MVYVIHNASWQAGTNICPDTFFKEFLQEVNKSRVAGVGHQASGGRHRAWGIGHRASGIGRQASGVGRQVSEMSASKFQSAQTLSQDHEFIAGAINNC